MDDYRDQGLIFPSQRGTLMNANPTSRSFKPILGRASLPDIRLHDLRHTCGTLMLWEGVHNKACSGTPRHATISITFDTYSHWLPCTGDEAAGATESIFGRRKEVWVVVKGA
jgi:integrase